MEKTEEKKVVPEKKEDKNRDETDGTKNEDNEKTKLDANGEVINISKLSCLSTFLCFVESKHYKTWYNVKCLQIVVDLGNL